MASRNICVRPSNLSNKPSTRASVPTSSLTKTFSEYLAIDLLDFLGIAVSTAELAVSPYLHVCYFRRSTPCAATAGTQSREQQIQAASSPRSKARGLFLRFRL